MVRIRASMPQYPAGSSARFGHLADTSHTTATARRLHVLRLVALTLLAACSGAETSKSMAKNPPRRPPPEVDAGESCPRFNDAYVEAYKACDVDADCEAVTVQLSCSGTKAVYGVAIDDREEFDRCV